jgi:hypothetical protein
MTTFATTSKTIRLALALTVLTPLPSLAETLTAREMLAQAQKQAVTLPAEVKKPSTTELAKLEMGKPEPARTQPTKAEPPQAELAPPLPIIVPVAPENPAPAASASQGRPTSASAFAAPAPETAKPPIAAIAPVPVAPPAVTAPAIAPAPVTSAAPVATPAAAAPTPEPEARMARPSTVAPTTSTASAAGTQSSAAFATKTARASSVKASGNPSYDKLSARRPHGSHGEPSFGAGPTLNARMISQIMRRPEVQSLLAQYGAQ